ncbi:hypothetical protein BIFPSEUDO_03393 [Bifidobacterium pseudocatenulatum DSM 20438 = JCM 1200 = LMG 10505]|uniref:Uncharacterized protein n=1 Tax=Bifidobacterium pseudocatenulatum DSM 20438 = JCM 1200 = LMG 10505 TaxID=547043 RepID=C0BRX9_BIFPS|nr:hypothetical protein BIFPSEUDO_03393 [Bifidobacterium pseudocatenulatum DSM 20438 = JCM 1200 = LMG 10505]
MRKREIAEKPAPLHTAVCATLRTAVCRYRNMLSTVSLNGEPVEYDGARQYNLR